MLAHMPEPTGVVGDAMIARGGKDAAPRVRLIAMGSFAVNADCQWPRHQHLEYEAIVPIRGRYRARINAIELAVPVGHLLLLKPMDWHQDLLARGTRYWSLQFALVDASLRTAGGWFRDGLPIDRQVCRAPREAVALLQRMRDEIARGDGLSALIQDAIAGEFAWRVARAFDRAALAPGLIAGHDDDGFATRLERWFQSRLHERVGVDEMARAMGMGRSALSAACQRHLGLSPARAFMRFKLDRAHELLTRTGMSVNEVADHLGFENQFHFSRAFKRRWNVPPSRVGRG